MKKIKIILGLLLLLSPFLVFSKAHAVDCWPSWNGNWTVEANCTYPGNFKIYGDIIVGTKTVTVPSGRTVGIDLSTKKATFTTGKMLFQGTAKMNNGASSRYYRSKTYASSNPAITNCPAGTKVMNTGHTAIQGSTVTAVSSSGTMYCAKI